MILPPLLIVFHDPLCIILMCNSVVKSTSLIPLPHFSLTIVLLHRSHARLTCPFDVSSLQLHPWHGTFFYLSTTQAGPIVNSLWVFSTRLYNLLSHTHSLSHFSLSLIVAVIYCERRLSSHDNVVELQDLHWCLL